MASKPYAVGGVPENSRSAWATLILSLSFRTVSAIADRCELRDSRLDCANIRRPLLAVGRVDSGLTDQLQS